MNDDVAAKEEESINRLTTVITTQYGQSKSEQYCVRQTSANALQEWQTYMPSKLIAISTSSSSEKRDTSLGKGSNGNGTYFSINS